MLKYFVDCGAFDGDTAKSALKFAFTEIKKMYLFLVSLSFSYYFQCINKQVIQKLMD